MQSLFRANVPRIRLIMVFCASLMCVGPVWAGELLAFPSISGAARNADDGSNSKDEIQAALDVFYSLNRDSLRFLMEFVINRDERELERAQAGIATASSYSVWIGRFHTPISYWNTAYHHGAYMQTTIARPGISEYEDGHGVLPMHTTGVLLEGATDLAKSQVSYDVALGFGPVLKETLEPLDIFDWSVPRKLSLSAKLGFQPLDHIGNEVGFFAGYMETDIKDRLYTKTKQTVAGVYFNKEWVEWRFLGEITLLQNRLEDAQGTSFADFQNIYIQGEYKASPGWLAYGRIEESNETRNPYLDMFPGFVSARALIGARWEPVPSQAIKFEFTNTQQQAIGRFREFSVQWSMAYP